MRYRGKKSCIHYVVIKRTLSGNVSLVRGGSDLEKKERMQLRPHRISGLRKKIAHSASH